MRDRTRGRHTRGLVDRGEERAHDERRPVDRADQQGPRRDATEPGHCLHDGDATTLLERTDEANVCRAWLPASGQGSSEPLVDCLALHLVVAGVVSGRQVELVVDLGLVRFVARDDRHALRGFQVFTQSPTCIASRVEEPLRCTTPEESRDADWLIAKAAPIVSTTTHSPDRTSPAIAIPLPAAPRLTRRRATIPKITASSTPPSSPRTRDAIAKPCPGGPATWYPPGGYPGGPRTPAAEQRPGQGYWIPRLLPSRWQPQG